LCVTRVCPVLDRRFARCHGPQGFDVLLRERCAATQVQRDFDALGVSHIADALKVGDGLAFAAGEDDFLQCHDGSL
jgi:hypothetical protein